MSLSCSDHTFNSAHGNQDFHQHFIEHANRERERDGRLHDFIGKSARLGRMNRLATRIVAAVIAVLGWTTAAASSGSVLQVDCSTNQQRARVVGEQPLTIGSSDTQALFLRITERGELLQVTANDDAVLADVSVPFRYGSHLARLAPGASVQISRAMESKRPAGADIRVDCGDDPAAARQRDWWRAIAAATKPLDGFLAERESTKLLETVNALAAKAESASDAALATHVRAQVLLLSNRNADSVVAFADAAKAWRVAGDEARARVALVGEVEDLQRLARHTDALALVDNIAANLPERDYFAARLRLSRCLTLRYLGRMPEALRCFKTGVAAMDALDEVADLVSALQDMADVSRFLGDLPSARQLGLQALQQSALPKMEIQRGRIHRMLGDIAIEEGDVATALREFDLALTEFTASGSPRWQANLLLQTAQLYADLGALDEAADMVSAALGRLSERDAPARVAAARVVRADIDARRGRFDVARRGLTDALLTYRSLAMPADLDSTRLAQARLALQGDDVENAAEIFSTRDKTQHLNDVDWQLLAARIDVAKGECQNATAALQKLERKITSIASDIERVTASAECLAQTGKTGTAQALLFAKARQLASLTRNVDSALLRQMLIGYIAPLRRSAFELAARAEPIALSTQSVWRWLRLDDVATHRFDVDKPSSAEQFDGQVAKELLGKSSASAAASSTHLLKLLAQQNSAKSRNVNSNDVAVSLSDFQQRLGDTVFVSYVDAGDRSYLLWIDRDGARLQATLAASTLRDDTERLLALVGSPASPIKDIASEGERISSALFVTEPTGRETAYGDAPSSLLIDAASPLAALPWSLLNWPGSSQPLLDSTRFSIVRIGAKPSPVASPTSDVTVLVAGQQGSDTLAALWNARGEPGLIAKAIGPHGGHVIALKSSERSTVLDAFSKPHTRLHIAAHGDAKASRIGYAGIWLDAQSATKSPVFISWLDILARGSRSDLVVLNACDLAQAPGSRAAALGFADAVSRAGAHDVVAASWQVSDAATSLWVPAFYRRLAEGAEPADALWQARRQLRDSRRFRHPFHWAGWVHFSHL